MHVTVGLATLDTNLTRLHEILKRYSEVFQDELGTMKTRGGRTCSRASVEEFNLMSGFCYFSLFWLDYGQLKKLHTANGNSSTHADLARAFQKVFLQLRGVCQSKYF